MPPTEDVDNVFTDVEKIQVQQILKKHGIRARAKVQNDEDEEDEINDGGMFQWQQLPCQMYIFPIVCELRLKLNPLIYSRAEVGVRDVEQIAEALLCTCRRLPEPSEIFYKFEMDDTCFPILSAQLVFKKVKDKEKMFLEEYYICT